MTNWTNRTARTSHRIAVPQPGIYFRPRHNGCRGGGDKPLKLLDDRRGLCPECLGEPKVRNDGLLAYHRRKDNR